ncbi:hypothetical protein [Flavobacterium pedocola]
MKTFITLSFLLLVCISCDNKDKQTIDKEPKYLFDVLDDSALETLSVESDLQTKKIKNIYIFHGNEKVKICSIDCTDNPDFVTKTPSVENVYLEANNIQTNEKGFRIIQRNTDFSPDICYLDFKFEKEWFIKSFGIINTGGLNTKPFICNKEINRSLKSFNSQFGKESKIDMKYFVENYFDGKLKCE